MFIIKALLMTRLECIFAYRILPLLMRSWVTLINFLQTIAIPDQNPIILFCLATKLRSGERQREDTYRECKRAHIIWPDLKLT